MRFGRQMLADKPARSVTRQVGYDMPISRLYLDSYRGNVCVPPCRL